MTQNYFRPLERYTSQHAVGVYACSHTVRKTTTTAVARVAVQHACKFRFNETQQPFQALMQTRAFRSLQTLIKQKTKGKRLATNSVPHVPRELLLSFSDARRALSHDMQVSNCNTQRAPVEEGGWNVGIGWTLEASSGVGLQRASARLRSTLTYYISQ